MFRDFLNLKILYSAYSIAVRVDERIFFAARNFSTFRSLYAAARKRTILINGNAFGKMPNLNDTPLYAPLNGKNVQVVVSPRSKCRRTRWFRFRNN